MLLAQVRHLLIAFTVGDPHRITKLINVILTQHQVLAFDAQVQVSDYIRKLMRGRELETAWRADYEYVALTAQRLIDTAHRLGARVHEQATLAHRRDATLGCKVVVLFAHWRGAKIDRNDLLAEPEFLWQQFLSIPASTTLMQETLLALLTR